MLAEIITTCSCGIAAYTYITFLLDQTCIYRILINDLLYRLVTTQIH